MPQIFLQIPATGDFDSAISTQPQWGWNSFWRMSVHLFAKSIMAFLTRRSRLEEPCLSHIHGDSEKSDHPTGHALTVSSQLLSMSPLPSPSSAPEAVEEACKKAPASILERLLALSTSLVIEGELTPVQAWKRIRNQPQFDRLDADGLLTLTKRLSEAVKCHG